jgi:hypothetical protein
MVRINPIKLNGLRYFELYVRDVFYGVYVTRDDARAAAMRWDAVFGGLVPAETNVKRVA